jgi:hypothetical protein
MSTMTETQGRMGTAVRLAPAIFGDREGVAAAMKRLRTAVRHGPEEGAR